MIDTSQILTQADKYAFSLFDPDLVDFDMLEYDKYGIISLPLITSKLPKPNEPFDNEDTMMLICDAIDYGDMWFTYDPIHHRVEELVVECMCIQQQISCDSSIYFMGQVKHPEYDKYKQSYDRFVADIKDRLKEQVRSIMTEVKGEFVKDIFIKDNYVQSRNCDQTDIYYIINKWWEKLVNREVNFTDIDNGEGTVFVAINT